MIEHDEREAMRRALAKKRVVYHVAGMESGPVRRNLLFRGTSGAELPMDVYYPSSSGPQPPVVVIPVAYPDRAGRMRAFGPLTSWAELLAASGIAAVVYGAEAPAEDVHAVLRHLRASADTLDLDGSRLGLFATSANVTVGLSALIRDKHLACAAFLHGYTMDVDGSTAVADAAAQFGFANACAGRSLDELPLDVPVLFVRAGRDTFVGLNAALDEVIRQALARNVPLWLINHAEALHGFDVDDASDASRGVIQHVLAFLRLQLLADGRPL